MAGHLPAESAPGFTYKTEGTSNCIARCRELLSDRGQAPGSRLGRDVLAGYRSLDAPERAAFFDALATEFSVDPEALRRAAGEYSANRSDRNVVALRRASRSPRQELFLRLNAASGGTGLLVAMREQLLKGIKAHPSWAVVEADLGEVLQSLFNRGLLEFQQIDCETSPAVLEKLFEYEAVHEIRDWNDLRRRLDADRRCYALFHPCWPDEPLIFTELALTQGMSAMLQPILSPDSPILDADACRCAIFYSISNCQPGLRGFAFGNALIGRVIDTLRVQMPWLTTFATLSPIPGFHPWLSAIAHSSNGDSRFAGLMDKLTTPEWYKNSTAVAELKQELVPLCVSYLLHAKEGDEPADPVARFHLANGARLQRVNWMSDVSPYGLDRSFGLTANYVYHPDSLPRNCEDYRAAAIIKTTRQLERLSKRIDFSIPQTN